MKTNKWFLIFAAGILGSSLATGCALDDAPLAADDDLGTTEAPLYGEIGENTIDGEYIVVFKNEASVLGMSSATERVIQARGDNRVIQSFSVIPGFHARLDSRALSELRSDPSVAYIERDQRVQLSAVQSGPRTGLDRIDERDRPNDGLYNDRGFNGTGVHVYVIDTGLRADHVEFTGRVGAGATAINDGRGTSDCQGHGTHVASTVLGTVTGVAKNAIIHPVRVLDCNGSGSNSGVIAGIDFVATNGVRPAVANLSLGGGASNAVDAAIRRLFDSGVTPVVAAGNENQNACNVSPAREPKAITVAAVDDNDRRASFSNFGSCVDIFAPGVNVLGAGIGSSTQGVFLSGTSMASPHVAGVAAQFLDKNPNATPSQVTNAIRNAATTSKVSNRSGSPHRLLFNGI